MTFSKRVSAFKYLLKYCKSISNGLFLLGTCLSLINALSPFVFLYFSAKIIMVLTNESLGIVFFLKVLIAFIMSTGALRLIQVIVTYYYNLSINQSSMISGIYFSKELSELNYESFESNDIRDEQRKIANNLQVGAIFEEIYTPFLKNGMLVVGFSLITFSVQPVILVCLIFVIIFKTKLTKTISYYQKKLKDLQATGERRLDYLFNLMSQIGYGKEVRLKSSLLILERKYDEYQSFFYKESKRIKRSLTGYYIITNLLDLVFLIIQYGYVILLFLSGRLLIGKLVVVISSMLQFFKAINDLLEAISMLAVTLKSVEEYQLFLVNNKSLVGTKYEKVTVYHSNTLTFENVSFSYENSDKYVLKDVSFSFNTDERLALVGHNGSGKTTIVKLICKLYTPSSGRILFNNHDIQTIDNENWKEIIGVIFQDFQLFSLTVWQNITLDLPREDSKIKEVLKKSGLYSKISTLPSGVDTEITKLFDKTGIELSGGENQKLAVSRMYYKEPPILLLDEPSSALDPISERLLYESWYELMSDHASLFITHRLGSILFCNRIIVLNKGQIIEEGTHDALMNKKGQYAEMYNSQASYYFGGSDE
ncbi:ABC transporter ATP-binding protein/permease [Vagococcus sp. PNs007]|uniref:ABC transporter ATP-binding protein/permease n=1 Tax=Vagococcus proximus TaxID=2991417 RepID=A0ABT5X1X1_9ENTE|nr:ABC transporter ATP-binding protein [Vagococcus proximus]MDF0479990.1 ABC transporter ATP-binding protein/permease [Vagococcus proximus]